MWATTTTAPRCHQHLTSWADGRVAISGASQQDAFTDRELVGDANTNADTYANTGDADTNATTKANAHAKAAAHAVPSSVIGRFRPD